MTHGRGRLVAMAVLATAFLIRVAAQAALVAGWAPGLPSLEQWQSGLLPYPALLVSQVAILGFLGVALWHAHRGGPLASPGRIAGPVRVFAVVYAASMVARYVLTRLAHPEWGLLGHTIPIWLHLALAAWVWLWCRPPTRRTNPRTASR